MLRIAAQSAVSRDLVIEAAFCHGHHEPRRVRLQIEVDDTNDIHMFQSALIPHLPLETSFHLRWVKLVRYLQLLASKLRSAAVPDELNDAESSSTKLLHNGVGHARYPPES